MKWHLDLSVFLFDKMKEQNDHAEAVERQDDRDVDARGVRRLLVHLLQRKVGAFVQDKLVRLYTLNSLDRLLVIFY